MKKLLCLAILLAVVAGVVGCGAATTPPAAPPKTGAATDKDKAP